MVGTPLGPAEESTDRLTLEAVLRKVTTTPHPVIVIPLTNSPAIDVRGLHKQYGTGKAVDGIDLQVHEGEIFALLGPNGAGKTTTVKIFGGIPQAQRRFRIGVGTELQVSLPSSV